MSRRKISVTRRLYCKCGATMHVMAPRPVANRALELFWSVHQGPGHGACDSKAAAAARRGEEGKRG